ncbi:hypothetical protein ACWEDZ_32395, partial [Streptomyces sp. NPDC005047]
MDVVEAGRGVGGEGLGGPGGDRFEEDAAGQRLDDFDIVRSRSRLLCLHVPGKPLGDERGRAW